MRDFTRTKPGVWFGSIRSCISLVIKDLPYSLPAHTQLETDVGVGQASISHINYLLKSSYPCFSVIHFTILTGRNNCHLFDGDALSQIPWEINWIATVSGSMIGKKLQGYRINHWGKQVTNARNPDH